MLLRSTTTTAAGLTRALPGLAPTTRYRASLRPWEPFRTSYSTMLQGCTLRDSLAKKGGGASFGFWQTLPGANVSRTLARAGADWVLVDCEHGNIDGKYLLRGGRHPQPVGASEHTDDRTDAAMHEAVPAIASCGVSPIVRLPDMQGWMIKRKYMTYRHPG